MKTKIAFFLRIILLATCGLLIFGCTDEVDQEVVQNGYVSERVDLDILETDLAVKYNIDDLEVKESFVEIIGWGFIEGSDTHNILHYILLKKDDELIAFDTDTFARPDVTEYFKDLNLDLDDAGFIAIIPVNLLGEGNYQIGLYIIKNGKEGGEFSEFYLEL